MAAQGHSSGPPAPARFSSLDQTKATPIAGRRATGVAVSLLLHATLVAAALVLPVLFYEALPTASDQVARAFFAEPLELAPPPPPPPPPPAGARRMAPRPAPAPPPVEAAKLVAPVEMPETLPVPEATLDLGFGSAGGVPGGVEGGVPGGVVGGIVGGLPPPPPPPPPRRVVRIGGDIVAPELVRRVDPVYPSLAQEARVQGVVILEARVDVRGRVADVRVLRGHPLLDEPALSAVRQWRYRPLLLNGEPTEFILTVTVNFRLLR
jgi:protein TonB